MSAPTTAVAQKSVASVLTAAPAATLQRQCDCGQHALGGECEECRQKRGVFSRSALGRFAPAPGQPLDPETRTWMEARFHHDFSGVRVHTDDQAAESARALRANAWTLGQNIVFGAGAYAPHQPEGRRLLAHELAHVVQQEGAPAMQPQTALEVSDPGDPAEREAERAASRVTQGAPAGVSERWDRPVINRDAWQTAGQVAKVAGIVGGSALVAYTLYSWYRIYKGVKALFGSDASNSCDSDQTAKVNAALEQARTWTRTALQRVQAFRAHPAAPESAAVKAAFELRFRSSAPEVVEKVERVLIQVQKRTEAQPTVECHTDSDQGCKGSNAPNAYVPGGNTIVFCPKFFDEDSFRNTGDIVHEIMHSLMGGAHIADRGYQGERTVGGDNEPARFTTEEALTNADSYGVFVAGIATGKSYGKPAPADEIDCPEAWQGVVKDAIARAERAVISVVQSLRRTDEQGWQARWQALNLRGKAPDLDRAHDIYNKTFAKIGNQIRLVCRPNDNECAHGDAEWSDSPPTITVCAAWKNRPEAERIVQMVAALYGLYADASDPDRVNLARVAVAAVDAPPDRKAVFGSPLWTPDLLSVTYLARTPQPKANSYEESGTRHTRLSQDLPVYQAPACGKSQLPFKFNVMFKIDTAEIPRPGPVTPPHVSREYQFSGDPALSGKEEDTSPTQITPGNPLGTTLQKKPVDLTLASNGVLEIVIQMDDPDSSTVRRYCDRINVLADRPCPDTPAPAVQTQALADPCAEQAPAEPIPAGEGGQ